MNDRLKVIIGRMMKRRLWGGTLLCVLYVFLVVVVSASYGDYYCKGCRPGHYSNTSVTECGECNPGTCASNSTCPKCSPGWFANEDNSTQCKPCPEGAHASHPGSTGCVACEKGSFQRDQGAAECTPCPIGTFGPEEGLKACVKCADGTVANKTGLTVCEVCPAGTSNDGPHVTCVPCAPGQFQPGTSSTGAACMPCPLGSYSADNASVSCTLCAPAYYTPSTGCTACKPCPKGTFGTANGTKGLEECIRCDPGYYCPDEATTEPKICPAKHRCPEGSSKPEPCPKLMDSEQGAAECSPTGILILVMVASGTVVAACIGVFVFCGIRMNRRAGLRARNGAIPLPSSSSSLKASSTASSVFTEDVETEDLGLDGPSQPVLLAVRPLSPGPGGKKDSDTAPLIGHGPSPTVLESSYDGGSSFSAIPNAAGPEYDGL